VTAILRVLCLGLVLGLIQCAGKAPKLQTARIVQTQMPDYQGQPIFLRIIKRNHDLSDFGVLEAFIQGDDGQFKLYKAWPICTYSGALGPKLKEGDGQSPEGFYFIKRSSLNPNSSYHLSFNLGFPNAYDRAQGRTGSFLMVHGNCVSIGCYAMGDENIEEIYALVDQALKAGQPFIRIHIFPFEMSAKNIEHHADNHNLAFWQTLKKGWDWFEQKGHPPNVTVINKQYMFEAAD